MSDPSRAALAAQFQHTFTEVLRRFDELVARSGLGAPPIPETDFGALLTLDARSEVLAGMLGWPPAVERQSVDAGAALSRWFGEEARRVYGVLAEGEEGRERRRLVEWVQRKGGTVTPRDLQMGDRRYRDNSEAAELALGELVKVGIGCWVPAGTTDRGGRPTRAFRLVNAVNVNVNGAPPGPKEFAGSVDVDNFDRGRGASAGDVFECEL